MAAIWRGAFWMVAAALSFAVLLASVRELSDTFPTIEIVFVRALVGIFLIAPMLAQGGLARLRTRRLGMHFARTAFAFAAMLSMYYGLIHIPVGDVTALSFLIPVFCTLAAGLVLRERVDGARWAATAVGFLGALAIVRPGLESVSLPMLSVLLSCAFYAGAWTSVKLLTATEPASTIVFYMNLMMLPLTLVPSLFVWVTPGWQDLPALLIMGLSGWAAHFCQARAFAAADASAVMPFDFLRLPFTAGLGWLLFAEAMDVWTWIGAGVIFASTYFITLRESRGRGG